MILDQLAAIWQQLIDVTSLFVIPDWGALITLLPVLLVIGVLGPIVTLVILGWLVYALRRPSTKVRLDESPAVAPIDEDGSVAYPVGLPYCPADRLVYASGAHRCRECGTDLAVICPMCGLGRAAGVTTCGNCGLVLKVEPRARLVRPSGPPPGGAAVA